MSHKLLQKDTITKKDLVFGTIEVYERDDHSSRSLVRHISTGDLYYHDYWETIDWSAGNDPQYNIYTPKYSKIQSFILKARGRSKEQRSIKYYWHADDRIEIKIVNTH